MPSSLPAEEAFALRLLAIGRWHARRCSLAYDDGEDCALEFVIAMLATRTNAVTGPTGDPPLPWIHRCARNHTYNFLTRHQRHQRRHLTWPSGHTAQAEILWDITDLAADGESVLLGQAQRQQLLDALARLPDDDRFLLLRHHVRGDSIVVLSVATGRTPTAIKQSLFQARHRLRAHYRQLD